MQRYLIAFEAYWLLIWHDMFMSHRSFASLCRKVRALRVESQPPRPVRWEDVDSALSLACAFYPKQVLCLQRSAVLVKMLRSRGIAAEMMIGIQDLPFRAHAWIAIAGGIHNDRLASRETFHVLEVL